MFVSAAVNATGATINAPSGIVAGNLLLAFVGTTSGAVSCAGWTAVGSGGSSEPVTVLYKTATGSEPASYTFSTSGTSHGGCILQYSGLTVPPTDAYAFGSFNSSTPLAVTIPSVATSHAADLIVGMTYDVYGNSTTVPSGMTQRVDTSAYSNVSAWDLVASSAGSYGPWSSTLSGSGAGVANGTAVTVALIAASGGSGATATGSFALSGAASVSTPAVGAGTLTLSGSGTASFTLSVTVTGATANLSWPSQGSATYVIQRDGVNIAFGVTGTTYTDTPPAGQHTYRVGVLT